MTKEINSIPLPAARRLSRYFTYLQLLKDRNKEWIYSDQIADDFLLSSITVRRDIAYLKNFSGVPKRGYKIRELLTALKKNFTDGNTYKVVIIGTGESSDLVNIYEELFDNRFEICGVFDHNPFNIGERVGCFDVQNLNRLPHVVWDKKVEIGIIAVSESLAQNIADLLVIAGIRGILNLTSIQILVPKNVVVINISILTHLLELSYMIHFEE